MIKSFLLHGRENLKYLERWLLHKGYRDENWHSKDAFNRKISLLTSKLNIELRKTWLRAVIGTLHCKDYRPGN